MCWGNRTHSWFIATLTHLSNLCTCLLCPSAPPDLCSSSVDTTQRWCSLLVPRNDLHIIHHAFWRQGGPVRSRSCWACSKLGWPANLKIELGIHKISFDTGLLANVLVGCRTVSADGIQSFVAGLLVHRTKLADEWPLVVTLKALPLGRSTLIKPVPVCKEIWPG